MSAQVRSTWSRNALLGACGALLRLTFSGLLWTMSVSAAGAQSHDPLPEIRRLYLEAVESESSIEPAEQAIRDAREWSATRPESELDAILTAYSGAVTTLRAKHGFWPPSRLSHLREGLAVMDAMIAEHPRQAEIRYLRLMSCFYLPGILGRNWSVREDFAVLAELLPRVEDRYPPDLHAAIIRFVLENGRISPEQTARLQSTLAPADDS